MSAKRALIVDDSRSARVILGRMLETHGLQVDTAESGEQALDYLRSARPDVVFLDHLMPGMDGFEALRAIKANHDTAAIPVMMYTSQEGDHYLQQARRVGALGVLSKTLKATDVSRALYELNLLPDRRELGAAPAQRSSAPDSPAAHSLQAAENASVAFKPAPTMNTKPEVERDLRASLELLLTEQHGELQQQWQANWDAILARLNDRLSAQVRDHVRSALQDAASQRLSTAEGGGRRWRAAALIFVALVPTVFLGFLYWRALDDNRSQLQQSTARLAMVVTEQQTQIEQLRVELHKRQDNSLTPSVGTVEPAAIVPYGEPPLAGARVQRMRALLERLQAEGFRGKVLVTTYVGDFCLSGSAADGYALAQDAIPMRRCDLVGNPYEDTLAVAQEQSLPQAPRQSPEFAQWVTGVAAATGGAIRVELHAGGRKPSVAYPTQTERLTAGEWNSVATRNNRVEFTLLPVANSTEGKAPGGKSPTAKLPTQPE